MGINLYIGMTACEPNRDGLGHRGNIKRMGQAGEVEVIFSRLKHLRFCLEPTKGSGEKDAIKILLKDAAIILATLRIECVVQAVPIKRAVKIVLHFLFLEAVRKVGAGHAERSFPWGKGPAPTFRTAFSDFSQEARLVFICVVLDCLT